MRVNQRGVWLGVALLTLALARGQTLQAADVADLPQGDEALTFHVAPFQLPVSDLLGPETRAVLRRQTQEAGAHPDTCPPDRDADKSQMPVIRKCQLDLS